MQKHNIGIIGMMMYFIVYPACLLADEPIKSVEYKDSIIIDTDLDGLTDDGEEQLFRTNPRISDTDGDGLFDGTEILSGSDPFNPGSTHIRNQNDVINDVLNKKTSWAWYVGRASGIVSFLCLWFSIAIALSMRNSWLKNFFSVLYRLDLHIFLSISAFFWGILHSVSFLFDDYVKLSLSDVLIPFYSQSVIVSPIYLAFGSIALYGFFILIIFGIFRSIMPRTIFRLSHFLNIPVVIMVIIHASKLGTDMHGWVYAIFISASGLLAIFWLITILVMLKESFKRHVNFQEENVKN